MQELSPFLFFILLGAVLVIAELAIFNLSVFWFLFIGIGALITAVVALVIPELSWFAATLLFIASSIVISAALYPLFRRWQQKPSAMPGNDAIGQTVTALTDIGESQQGKVQWSGATWDAKIQTGTAPIKNGEQGKILAINGIVLEIARA